MLLQLTDRMWVDVLKISFINWERRTYAGLSSIMATIVIDGCKIELNELELAEVIKALQGQHKPTPPKLEVL